MKNIAINALKYAGIVTLSQYIGKKKYKVAQLHNEGGNALFDFLSDCLVGDFDRAKLNRPTKIMLVSREANGDQYEYVSESGFFYLLTTPEKVYDVTDTSATGRVRYSFTIPQNDIENIHSFNKLGIGLYTDNEESPDAFAAYCEFDVAASSLVNTALLVDWELVIHNTPKQE